MKVAVAILVLVLVLLGANSSFVVNEGENALLLQFGRIVRDDYPPGLHLKLPLVQQVRHFDGRVLSLDAEPERYFTAEKKSVNVDFYVKWRVADAAAYYRATGGDQTVAEQRLVPQIKDALRSQFEASDLSALIAAGPRDIAGPVRAQAGAVARRDLGIDLVDVRIKRIDLPDEASEAVYKRMRAEQVQLANDLRFGGQEAAEKIQADADRQGQVLKADAERDAAKVRGEGDAQAAAIYAQAYGQDPEFFAFYRSLNAYRTAFGGGKGVLVLKPGSEFLKYFDDAGATKR